MIATDEMLKPRITEACGRKVMVQYTCQRCGKTESVPYGTALANSDNLSSSELPDGWVDLMPGLLCVTCADSFGEWWREVDKNNAAD